MALRISALCFLLSDMQVHGWTYPAIGGYMPVSNVLEHSQIIDDVTDFNSKVKGGDFSRAKEIYTKGGGSSCKGATKTRKLIDFARKDLSGESFADAFYKTFGLTTKEAKENNLWDKMITEALDGKGDFDGLSDKKRQVSLQKGILGLVTFYASHELEAAIQKAANNETRSKAKSGHAWDEGWAFYYGNNEYGKNSPWEVAQKRDADHKDIAANKARTMVKTEILPYFNSGLKYVLPDAYDKQKAEDSMNAIYSQWAITYLRAGFKYLEFSEKTYDEGKHAEGYAYYMAVDGWIGAKSQRCKEAAKAMRDALKITKTKIEDGTFCAAKKKMEQCYPDLNIDCTKMGKWKDTTMSCSQCSTDATFPGSGSSAHDAVEGDKPTDIKCEPEWASDNTASFAVGRTLGLATLSLFHRFFM